jgi:hypothetical protein
VITYLAAADTGQGIVAWWPAWLAIAVSGVIALNRAIEESSKFAAILGRFGKKMHDRALARKQVEFAAAELAEAVMKAVEEARRTWQTDENAALRALDGRLRSVAEVPSQHIIDMDEMRFQVRCLMAYSEYEATWHHRLQTKAAQAPGGCLDFADIPDHVDYWQFEKLYRVNERWRDWVTRETNGRSST